MKPCSRAVLGSAWILIAGFAWGQKPLSSVDDYLAAAKIAASHNGNRFSRLDCAERSRESAGMDREIIHDCPNRLPILAPALPNILSADTRRCILCALGMSLHSKGE